MHQMEIVGLLWLPLGGVFPIESTPHPDRFVQLIQSTFRQTVLALANS